MNGSEDVVYIYIYTHTHTQWNIAQSYKILPFVTKWMDLEGIMLSEISQRKANTVGFHLYVESKIQNKEKNIRKQNRLVDTENKQVVTRGERSWGMKGVKEIKR